jgi:hypothetical protein
MRTIFRSTRRIITAIVVGIVLLVVIVVGIAVSSNHHTVAAVKKPVTPPTSAAPAAPAPAPTTPTPSPSSDTTGPVGTTFVYTGQDDSGDNISYDVTLTQVDQNAPLGQYETLTNPGDHLVAARFTIKGVTGQVSDDANSDATATSADTTEYQPSDDDTSDGPNFSYGDWEVGPGQVQTGWVSFEVPAGESVTQIQWTPFDDDSFVTWNVG